MLQYHVLYQGKGHLGSPNKEHLPSWQRGRFHPYWGGDLLQSEKRFQEYWDGMGYTVGTDQCRQTKSCRFSGDHTWYLSFCWHCGTIFSWHQKHTNSRFFDTLMHIFWYQAKIFDTGTAGGASDKYQVCWSDWYTTGLELWRCLKKGW